MIFIIASILLFFLCVIIDFFLTGSLVKKKKVIAWSLYDFANQPFTTIVVTFIYSVFFTKYIAYDEHVGTVMWANSIAITAVIASILSPILGAIADNTRARKKFLFFFTLICSVSSILLFFPTKGQVYLALILFLFANISFELSTVFCNSYLVDLSNKKNVGRISGFAWGLGFLGGLLALFLCFLVFDLNNNYHIRQINILVGLWFIIFSVPTFLFLDDKKRIGKKKNYIKNSFKSIFLTFKSISKYSIISRFLLSRVFYNDGLVTIFGLGGIYAMTTLGFDIAEVMVLGIVLNIAAALGAFIFGLIEDYTNPKYVINFSLIVLIIATILAYYAPFTSSISDLVIKFNFIIKINYSLTFPQFIFWISGILIGLMVGPNQSCSRSLMARIIPKKKQNEFFGFFAFTGKATAFLGPFLFGLVTMYYDQQTALWIVILLFSTGLYLFNRIKFD